MLENHSIVRLNADFFERPLGEDHLRKLNSESREYENRILDIGKRLRYVYQIEKRGVRVRLKGRGRVVKLSLEPGHAIKKGDICELQLEV